MAIPDKQVLTLVAFRDRNLGTHRDSLEPRTIEGIELHFRHLVGAMGVAFPVAELKLADLQGYVDARAKAKGMGGKRLSAATIRKEIISLRTAWNWGAKMGLVVGRFPNDGLRYPKLTEKPPFQTRAKIERQVASGGLTKHQILELWHSLYLQSAGMEEALEHVRDHARHDWICAKVVTIREKKRVRGKNSTRRVPLSGKLATILAAYLETHPGGHLLFRQSDTVERSKKRSATTGHQSSGNRSGTLAGRKAAVGDRGIVEAGELTEDETHDHLKRVLGGSKWSVIRGWHVWRHSFVSACASKGIDQRILQAGFGHMTPEMAARYAHLYPSTQQTALDSVFG
ncbi:MAG: tyrosine-type recombinase/integrase [Isosphaeraceae bacterium]